MDTARTSGANTRRAILVVASLVVHLLAVRALRPLLVAATSPRLAPPVTVRMTDTDPLEAMTPAQRAALRRLEQALTPTPPPEARPEPPPDAARRGQVVETPAPERPRTPTHADYLAEHDNAVAEETRTERTRINPEVVSERYHDENQRTLKKLLDVSASPLSTGATPRGDRGPGAGTPGRDGTSPAERTTPDGATTRPPSDAETREGAGAPQNDRLAERRGETLALNTRAFAGAAYINRIKRQVNVYWNQQLDNLPPGTRLAAPRYETVVDLLLDGKGALLAVGVTHPSGSDALDGCVLAAFRQAGPFPNPPAQLIGPDGRIALPDLSFEVVLGGPARSYGGIDPRAGVQFPGIQKAPR